MKILIKEEEKNIILEMHSQEKKSAILVEQSKKTALLILNKFPTIRLKYESYCLDFIHYDWNQFTLIKEC